MRLKGMYICLITSLACFFGLGLSCFFHWYAQFLIISRSEFKVFWELFESMIFEKSEVSSAKILHIDIIPSGKSFIYIKDKRGPNTDPWGTPVFIFLQSEFWPFKTTLCFKSLRLTHLQLNKTLICIEDLYAKLYQ